MNSQTAFIIKILLYAAVISIFIKLSGRFISLNPTASLALVIVLLPSLIVALTLGWQYNQQ